MKEVDITQQSKKLFLAYVDDAPNWNGIPLVGGNVGTKKEDEGNLTQLKRAGLVVTAEDEGLAWMYFTPLGIEYAEYLGRTNYLEVWEDED